jgi:hypothetical protein
MIACAKVRELLSHLDDTKACSDDLSIRAAVSQALEDASEVVNLAERVLLNLTHAERSELAKHLWSDHAKGSCNQCPYQAYLSPWWAAVPSTELWQAWRRMEKRNRKKPPKWSAAKFLSIYLSLVTRGYQGNKVLQLRLKNGRLLLDEGNNRIRILGALGLFDVDVWVQTPP